MFMKRRKVFISKNFEETSQFAKKFVDNLLKSGGKCGKQALVVALEGNLGSGKTAFVKAAACVLGVRDTVTSPTFVLEKAYKLSKTSKFTHLIHIDAYRLENGAELLSLGWEEFVSDSQNIIFIEWSERVIEVLPADMKKVQFQFVNDTTRKIIF